MSSSEILKVLTDYFPAAVNTGNALIFISDQWRVELKEHNNPVFGQKQMNIPIVRVKVFKKALNGEFIQGHYEDFQIQSISELASQIERYIQFSVGQNIRENV